jgi:predicted ATPase with chaperone activity
MLDVAGQALGRTAVEVAAAGGHHALLLGPPGSGKTMLAERMPGLLPAAGPRRRARGDGGALRGRRRCPTTSR